MKQNVYVSASEIGEYVYCPRSWWLRFHGYVTGANERMVEGIRQHLSLASDLDRNKMFSKIALLLITIGIVLFTLLLIYSKLFSP